MTTNAAPSAKKPVPVPDDLSRGYWEAVNEGQLAIQRCKGCNRYHHPPIFLCPWCLSESLAFETVSGRGRIYTYTITYDARTPAFTALQPYAIVWVELAEQEGLILIANMPDTPLDQVHVGAEVEVCFERLDASHQIPQFRISGPAS